MNKFRKSIVVVLVAASALFFIGLARAATGVNLGSADGFAILAGSTITDAGFSVITGDLGVSPGTSITGFPTGIVNGTQHVTDSTAMRAELDLSSVVTNITNQAAVLTPTELGGATKIPAV